MSSYSVALYKLLNHPLELKSYDFDALRLQSPRLAESAMVIFENAMDKESERLSKSLTKTTPRRPSTRVVSLKKR